MTYARCSECGNAIQVEKVNNDVMMMWQGTHCGLAQAYFADEDIFETFDDLGEEIVNRDRARVATLGI